MNAMESIGVVVSIGSALWMALFIIRRLVWERTYTEKKEKVVVITGCDSGFGRDTAIRLVEEGCIVLAGCFQAESLKNLKDEVPHPDKMVTLPLDVSNDASVDNFVANIKAFLDENKVTLHGFVSNAGVFSAGSSEWMNRETMRRVFAVNTIGPMHLANMMAPLLHRRDGQPGGRMVSISSVSALVHGPMLSLYGASKGALDNAMSAMRVETQRNFSVHLILPGGFQTPLLNTENLQQMLDRTWQSTSQSVRDDFGDKYFDTFKRKWTEGVVQYADTRTSWVVDNVVHALFAEYPRDRYYTGKDAIIIFGFLSFAPTWLQDVILRFFNSRFFKSENGVVRMAVLDR